VSSPEDAVDFDYYLGICLDITLDNWAHKPIGKAYARKKRDIICKNPRISIFSLVFCRDLRMIDLIREIFKQNSQLLATSGTIRA